MRLKRRRKRKKILQKTQAHRNKTEERGIIQTIKKEKTLKHHVQAEIENRSKSNQTLEKIAQSENEQITMIKQISILILVLVLSSCGDQPEFEKVYSFNNKMWNQNVKPEYVVEIKDVDLSYDFTLSLRTTTAYKYQNLWFFMKTESPDGTTAREPFELMITNPDDGSWVGNKTGTVVETPLYFKSRKLPLPGTYKFTIEQGITESEVDEVLDLGFRVEKTIK